MGQRPQHVAGIFEKGGELMSSNMMTSLRSSKYRIDRHLAKLEDELKELGLLESNYDGSNTHLPTQLETLKHSITETMKAKVFEVFNDVPEEKVKKKP